MVPVTIAQRPAVSFGSASPVASGIDIGRAYVERELEFEWTKKMVALEEELGEFPPGGFGGGVSAWPRPKKSAALRARERVRFICQAVGKDDEL